MHRRPPPMRPRFAPPATALVAILAALLAALAAAPASGQQAVLAAPDERIGDQTIQADYRTYEAVQARIRQQNDRGTPIADYHLSKAQCWLDVSFHEYTRNDRSAFPQAALTESEKLVVAMAGEHGGTAAPITMETPLVNGAARLRPDLWSRIDAIKGGTGFRCAAQKTACAEVELVHAGNEYNQQQWRHAKPYVQIAEDLLADAGRMAERCGAPAATASGAAPAPARATEELLLAQVVFRFDRSGRADVLPASADQLDEFVTRLKTRGTRVIAIRLVGNADRLNGTRDAAYNQRLSGRRSATVRDLLVSKGIDAALIDASARGDDKPIEACTGPYASKAELEACLLPNRRVDVEARIVR